MGMTFGTLISCFTEINFKYCCCNAEQ